MLITLVALSTVAALTIPALGNTPFPGHGVYSSSGVKNLVTYIYLNTRMYDTLFEVLVFSLVVIGVSRHYVQRIERDEIEDEMVKTLFRNMGFFMGAASIYLALTGHEYPGGGFSAGVVGGAALLAMGISRGFDSFERELERYRVMMFEKMILGLIGVLSILVISGVEMIRLMNFLVYVKVMMGTWIITYSYMKHRGIVG